MIATNHTRFAVSLSESTNCIHEGNEAELGHYPMNTLVLNAFQPLKSYVMHRIDRLSSIFDLGSLIEKAKRTTKFSIHTTRAYAQGTVTRIVIEFLDIGQAQSTVLLFEVLYLPSSMTLTFL